MNWLDKLKFVKSKKLRIGYGGEIFIDMAISEPTWKKDELENIVKFYPWLPKNYIIYLEEFDSTSVTFCNFYGSELSNGINLQQEIEQNKSYLKNDYFAFGSYADGSRFIFNKKGQVLWWDREDFDFEEQPKLLADSFEEFINECLLGARYAEFSFTEDDDMWNFYKQQGWV